MEYELQSESTSHCTKKDLPLWERSRGEREIPSSTRGTLNDAEHRTLGIAVREERSRLQPVSTN